MTRYQTIIVWNGWWVDAGGYPFQSHRELVSHASRLKAKWSQNATFYYLEWDDEHPEELPVVRRFSNKELLGEEE